MEHTKRIYTSNWNRYFKYIKHTDLVPFAICRTLAPWVKAIGFEGEHHTFLAPSKRLLYSSKYGDGISNDDYRHRYLHELIYERAIDPEYVQSNYPDNSVLLCYEAPGLFCHRHVLADWIEQETGFVIPEWETQEERQARKAREQQNEVVDDLLGL